MIPGIEVTEIPTAALPLPEGGGLLDPNWRYVNAASTDIRKRFERVRQQQEAARAFAEAQQKKATLS